MLRFQIKTGVKLRKLGKKNGKHPQADTKIMYYEYPM